MYNVCRNMYVNLFHEIDLGSTRQVAEEIISLGGEAQFVKADISRTRAVAIYEARLSTKFLDKEKQRNVYKARKRTYRILETERRL